MNQISRPARLDPFRPHVSPSQVFRHAGWQQVRDGMLVGLRAGRPVALLGQPGSGKSLLLQEVAQTLRDEGFPARLVERGDALDLTPAQGPLLVDEAGTLDDDALQRLCETGAAVGLAGLPGFARRLEDLACRVETVTLEPLPPAEVAAFVATRLAEAGRPADLFAPDAVDALARSSRGLLRLVNALGRASLFLAEMEGAAEVSARHVAEADAMRRGIGEDPDAPVTGEATPVPVSIAPKEEQPAGPIGNSRRDGSDAAPVLGREVTVESSEAAERLREEAVQAASPPAVTERAAPAAPPAVEGRRADVAAPAAGGTAADAAPAAPDRARADRPAAAPRPAPSVWSRATVREAAEQAPAATPAQAMNLALHAVRAGAALPPAQPGTALVVVPQPTPSRAEMPPMLVTRPQRRTGAGIAAALLALLVGGAVGWTLTAQLRPLTTMRAPAEVNVASPLAPAAPSAPAAEAAPALAEPPAPAAVADLIPDAVLPAPPPAAPLPPASRAARPAALPGSGPAIEGTTAFRGSVFNETIGIGGRLSLVIRPVGPGGAVRVRFDASNGLVGAGELSGHLSADGYLSASGTLMMGRNPFECDLSGAIAGDRLNGAARFVRLGVDAANKAVTQSRFTLQRS